jgi:hypothetical protein
MTIRVKIENLEQPSMQSGVDEVKTVVVSLRPTSDLLFGGHVVGEVAPGETKEFYYYAGMHLVLAEKNE